MKLHLPALARAPRDCRAVRLASTLVSALASFTARAVPSPEVPESSPTFRRKLGLKLPDEGSGAAPKFRFWLPRLDRTSQLHRRLDLHAAAKGKPNLFPCQILDSHVEVAGGLHYEFGLVSSLILEIGETKFLQGPLHAFRQHPVVQVH
jgi:hypothetical protein